MKKYHYKELFTKLFKSKIFLCVFCLCYSFTVEASSTNTLKVWKANGQTETYYLSHKPKLTLTNQKAYLQIDNLVFEYPLSSYLKMTFEDGEQPTSIQEITVDNPLEDRDTKNALDADKDCFVYDIHGNLVKSISSSNGHVDSLNLPNGIYIVKSNNSSFKILVK